MKTQDQRELLEELVQEAVQAVEGMAKNRFRVVLTLVLVMKSVAVEVCADDVEPVGDAKPGYRAMAAYAR